MWIDFHTHGRLTKKASYDKAYFLQMVDTAIEVGLDAIVLSEHFNTSEYYLMYEEMKEAFFYTGDYYDIHGLKVFMGLEVDVKGGGHVLLIAKREEILTIRRALDLHIEKDSFIELEALLDLANAHQAIVIGAHPFRGDKGLAKTQDLKQLARMDAFDLNATDIHLRGKETVVNELSAFSKQLAKPILTGSDSHYPVQLGSVRTKIADTVATVEDLAKAILSNEVELEVSPLLDVKVFAARTAKVELKRRLLEAKVTA